MSRLKNFDVTVAFMFFPINCIAQAASKFGEQSAVLLEDSVPKFLKLLSNAG